MHSATVTFEEPDGSFSALAFRQPRPGSRIETLVFGAEHCRAQGVSLPGGNDLAAHIAAAVAAGGIAITPSLVHLGASGIPPTGAEFAGSGSAVGFYGESGQPVRYWTGERWHPVSVTETGEWEILPA